MDMGFLRRKPHGEDPTKASPAAGSHDGMGRREFLRFAGRSAGKAIVGASVLGVLAGVALGQSKPPQVAQIFDPMRKPTVSVAEIEAAISETREKGYAQLSNVVNNPRRPFRINFTGIAGFTVSNEYAKPDANVNYVTGGGLDNEYISLGTPCRILVVPIQGHSTHLLLFVDNETIFAVFYDAEPSRGGKAVEKFFPLESLATDIGRPVTFNDVAVSTSNDGTHFIFILPNGEYSGAVKKLRFDDTTRQLTEEQPSYQPIARR